MPKTKTKKAAPKPAKPKTSTKAPKPKAAPLSRLERALAIIESIPDAPGSEAKLKALAKGIAEARHPGRKP
jgi:hypothetical protein